MRLTSAHCLKDPTSYVSSRRTDVGANGRLLSRISSLAKTFQTTQGKEMASIPLGTKSLKQRITMHRESYRLVCASITNPLFSGLPLYFFAPTVALKNIALLPLTPMTTNRHSNPAHSRFDFPFCSIPKLQRLPEITTKRPTPTP